MTRLARFPAGVALFASSFVVEYAVCASVRCAAAWPLGWLAFTLTGAANADDGALVVALTAAWLPVALSLAALVGVPGGAHRTRRRAGARPPSRRERATLDDALAKLDPRVDAPRRMFVVDDPLPNAFASGTTLYVHRGLLADPALAAVVAHELGHLESIDARLFLAFSRLAPLPAKRRYLLFGGLSYVLLRPWFEAWLRRREHAADRFAADHGQALELAEFLERTQIVDVAVPFMRGRAHPYAEERIERLTDAAEAPGNGDAVRECAESSPDRLAAPERAVPSSDGGFS